MTWRDRLRPASFRAVPFHVDESDISGGRRVVPHEYPKRDSGYAEDMGRRMRTYRVRAYLIGDNHDLAGRLLRAALEADGAGLLVLPLFGEDLVTCGSFAYVETREQGGYATVDIDFLEAGEPALAAYSIDTVAAIDVAAVSASASVASSPMSALPGQTTPAQPAGGALDFSNPANSGHELDGWM